MIDEKSLIAGVKALSAGYAGALKSDFMIAPPYTIRDVQDMYAIKEHLHWLVDEITTGHGLREDIHGPTIRNISVLHKALGEKERAFQEGRNTESRTTTHYIWRTRDDDKVRPEHAANNGKVFSWDETPHAGYPGEDFGCRCWAEPFLEGALQEYVRQNVTTHTGNSFYAWGDADLVLHYFNGKGRDLFLGHIGLLQGVIQYAAIHPQKNGGSVFDRIARKIFVEARRTGEGNFRSEFGATYDFQDFLFSFGDSTVDGNAEVRVKEKEGFLSVSADIHYTFWDEFKDPLDMYDLIPIDYEPGDGVPFTILDTWTVRLEAMIKINSSRSIFQDDEFGTLSP